MRRTLLAAVAVTLIFGTSLQAHAAAGPTTLLANGNIRVEIHVDDHGLYGLDGAIGMSALLTRTADGLPLAGRMIEFSAGEQWICTAQTKVNGFASCSREVWAQDLLPIALANGYIARFAGGAGDAASTRRGPFVALLVNGTDIVPPR